MKMMHGYGFVKNVGIIAKVTRDGYCWYHSIMKACNHLRRTFGVNLPEMRSTKLDLLKMWIDLKQFCHENHHLFIEGSGKQDKLSIGCGEVDNHMFYNHLFEFCSIIRNPSNTSSILELIDDAMGKEIYNKILKILIIFLSKTKVTI